LDENHFNYKLHLSLKFIVIFLVTLIIKFCKTLFVFLDQQFSLFCIIISDDDVPARVATFTVNKVVLKLGVSLNNPL